MMGCRVKLIYSPTSAYKLNTFEFILGGTNIFTWPMSVLFKSVEVLWNLQDSILILYGERKRGELSSFFKKKNTGCECFGRESWKPAGMCLRASG